MATCKTGLEQPSNAILHISQSNEERVFAAAMAEHNMFDMQH